MKKVKTFDVFFWVSLISFFIVVALICCFPMWFAEYAYKHDFTKTGQIGDTIGGIMGPFIAIAAAILTFLAFWVQFKANEQQKADLTEQREARKFENFETVFFELIKLHRENISDLNYTKHNGIEFSTGTNRKVIREIFKEFLECYREVKKFSNSIDPNSYLAPQYRTKLETIKRGKGIRASIIELAIIDIAYSIVFYGLGVEGENILRDRFKSRYNSVYYYRLLAYIKLKPKRENLQHFQLWITLKSLHLNSMLQIVEEIYTHRNHIALPQQISPIAEKLIRQYNYEKYYGGHQHRLGHYFRHLFQSYKFLDSREFLTPKQKYFYGKTLRAQLSTYEQSLLFINSIASMGMRWEYTFEPAENVEIKNRNIIGLITTYNLIKNLPGSHTLDIKYKRFYRGIKYEGNET